MRAVVDRFKNHMHDFLNDFISYTWDAQFAHLAICFWDKGRPYGFEVKLLGPHFPDDLPDGFQREAIKGFFIRSSSHVSRFRFDPFVGENVQILFVHQPVHLVVYPRSVAIQLA